MPTERTSVPDQVIELLIGLILSDTIKIGDRLPPERKMAVALNVDRSSIRNALKALTEMGLLETVQGSGIRVLDYHRSAQLSFINRICQINELKLGQFWLSSAFHFIRTFLQNMVQQLTYSASEEALTLLLQHYQRQYEQADADPAQLAAAEIDIQHLVAYQTGNPFYEWQLNTQHHLQNYLMTYLFNVIDAKAFFNLHINMINSILKDQVEPEVLLTTMYRHYDAVFSGVNHDIQQQPQNTRLTASPLLNCTDLNSINRFFLTE